MVPNLRFLICSVWLLGFAASAHAHARLLRSSPPKDAALAKAPAQIELWFNELLDDGFNSIAIFAAKDLTNAKRTNFAKGKPALDPKDRTHLTVALDLLAPGDYVLEWRVLSRDGHSAPGRFNFRILAR